MNTYQLTESNRRLFDETGFLVIEGALSKSELNKLNAAVDGLYRRNQRDRMTGRMELRNCVAKHPSLLAMSDHRKLLPTIVDLLGPDIKLRTSELDVRPPITPSMIEGKTARNRWGEPEQWHIDGPLSCYPDVNGIVPMMEVRAGYFLTDLTAKDAGQLCVVPGSHRFNFHALEDPSLTVPPEAVFRVEVPAGSAVLFRTGVWHCATPNLSSVTRKVLYYAYTYRWVQASDHVRQSRALLAQCNSLQRQLLGGLPEGRHPLGDRARTTPCHHTWFTRPEDIPLLTWRQQLRQPGPYGTRAMIGAGQ
ncbi:MAG TPA: phytanoyl-CoA dioxygenase family protein [Bryobacteraceae bacterium]|jgi:ectoine hydroxylase-related dioxygenase (phytanoyl-CoA dioxygenase family)|nr:phytanoyl-CoA dioxygenase family protein [Bryobacteraceae bacterium]